MHTLLIPAIGDTITAIYRKPEGLKTYTGTVVKPNASQSKTGNIFIQIGPKEFRALKPVNIVEIQYH